VWPRAIRKKEEKKMTDLYQTTKCPVCGDDVEQTGKGRPREYHQECRRIAQQMSWLEDIISGGTPKNADTRKYIKSNLQRLANLTNGWGK
jgi:hypothetical protein